MDFEVHVFVGNVGISVLIFGIVLIGCSDVFEPVNTYSQHSGGERACLTIERRAKDTCRCTMESRGWRHETPMAEPAFGTTYTEEGLRVKQVRIQGAVCSEGTEEHRGTSVGMIKQAMESG
jgi:hypothetical protein